MSIVSFHVEGFELLSLRDIESVTITPKSKLQMILGTNGSGKTSLMGEMSPLAAENAKYVRGKGYKRLIKVHHGSEYECVSDFRQPKNHFSLYKDGNELYSGHSSQAYNSFVLQEFGLTPEIHAVRIGTTRFTSMKVDDRRRWLTRLCPEDFTYAVEYFKRLSASTRDLTGTINRLSERLMREKTKLIDSEEESRLRREIAQSVELKNSMMQHWRPMESSVEQSLEKVAQIDEKLLEMETNFNRMFKLFCNREGYRSQQDIWDAISKTQGRLTYSARRIDELCETIESNRNLLSQVAATASQDVEQIKADLAKVSREIENGKLILFVPAWETICTEALPAFDAVYPELMTLMDQLEEDTELRNTSNLHRLGMEELTQLGRVIEANKMEQARCQEQLGAMEHRKREGHTQCPKCEHVWFRGFSEDIQRDEQSKIERLGGEIERLTKEYEERSSRLEEQGHQLQVLDRILLLARSNPILSEMWQGLAAASFMRRQPKSAIEYVKSTRTQIQLWIEMRELQAKYKELEQARDAALATSGVSQQELLDRNADLEGQLYQLQQGRAVDEKHLASLKTAQQAMDYQERYVPLAEDLLSRREDLIRKAELANHHTAVNSIVMSIDAEIAEKERLISQIESQRRLILTLEGEIEDCRIKERLMKVALEKLSPSKGLIGRGLTGFINQFIEQINHVIEKVWMYPLELLPVEIKDGDQLTLDYKFYYAVDGKPTGVDIEKASGAQKEIIDIAFMLVSLVHDKMDDGEVFLDEFSIKMDYVHRKEAMKMVMDLIQSSNFSQIFMISHYESSYGTLADADITVLCPENIQLPSDLAYNVNAKVGK